MREKSKSIGPEVSTLDLLSEIEAKLIQLQAKHEKLRASAGKKAASRKKATAKKKASPKGLPVVAASEAPEETAPVKPSAKKRPALGRGLAQFIRHRNAKD